MSIDPSFQSVPLSPEEARARALASVEQLMIRLSAGHRLDRCGAMVVEHLATGGKRLRAQLALHAAQAVGVAPDAAVGWAAACELLHNASLIHDDLQDGDTVRRGRPTTWARYGGPQAINAGDLMLVLPPLALDHVPGSDALRWALSRILASGASDTVRGQSLEMSLLGARRFARSDYDAAARGKSGAFFALPVHGALRIAGMPEHEAAAVATHFETLGLLYQLADDLLDLYGDKGRASGGDLREGKITALVVEHLELFPGDEAWLFELLERDDNTDDEITEVRLGFRDGGAVEQVLDRIYTLSRSVFDADDLRAHPGLHRVACALVSKTLDPIRHLDPSLPDGPEAL